MNKVVDFILRNIDSPKDFIIGFLLGIMTVIGGLVLWVS